MLNLKSIILSSAILLSSNSFASTTFHCEGKRFNLGDVNVSLQGSILNSETITSVSLSLDGQSAFSNQNLKADSAYNAFRTLNRFTIPSSAQNRWVVDSFLAVLLPKNIGTTKNFKAYLTVQNSSSPRVDEISCSL